MQAGGYLSSSEGTQRNSSGAGGGDAAFLLNRKTRYLVFFGGKTMHACFLPATVTAVTSIHHSFSTRSVPVLTKMVPQSHVASYTLHQMSPAAGCTKITDSGGAGAFKASHSASNGGWHLKKHFRIVTSPQTGGHLPNISLLPPLPNALSIPFCFPFCFSLVSCDTLACHTPFKDIRMF